MERACARTIAGSSPAMTPFSDLLTGNFELVNPPAAVLGDIDIALGVHRDAVSLIELTRKLSDAAETRQHLAGLAVDDLDFPFEATLLVVQLDPRALPVADVDHPIVGHRHAVHGRHALRLPLAQEFSVAIHHRDAAVAASALAVGNVNVSVLPIDEDARRHEELGSVRIQRRALDGAVG